MARKVLILITLAAMVAACTGKPDIHTESLVVEGWITAGGPPVVMVSTSLRPESEKQSTGSLQKHVVRWAKVTVSDGTTSVILTGKGTPNYLPPHIYTTSGIFGEVGKTYSLTVEYSGLKATATTSVPQPHPLDSLRTAGMDVGGYGINAYFTDPPQSKDYYKFFTLVEGRDSVYRPAFMGNVDDANLAGGKAVVSLHRGYSISDPTNTSTPFAEGDRVRVMFCTLDKTSYHFWTEFEQITALSTVPIFQTQNNIPSNVEGALGYWAGYGANYYSITVK